MKVILPNRLQGCQLNRIQFQTFMLAAMNIQVLMPPDFSQLIKTMIA